MGITNSERPYDDVVASRRDQGPTNHLESDRKPIFDDDDAWEPLGSVANRIIDRLSEKRQ
jgi:hypothetical protein